MAGDNLDLYVATYMDPAAAMSDYKALKESAPGADFTIEESVVVSRDDDGKVTVKETGGGEVARGAAWGAGAGAIVGLFAPPFLLATAIGAGIGAVVGEFTKKHEENKLGVDIEEYLPEGSSAILVLLDDEYLDRVEKALAKADKRISKAIDKGDYDKLKKAIEKSEDEVGDAIDS